MSQCSGLLRHSVAKTSHLGINIPHNDMIFFKEQGLVQSDVVIPDKDYNNEMLKQVQHDSLLYCHSEGVLVTEESHNFLCSTLEGTVISKGVKKKAAFTLVETLITLGIIGIVAAMTIPTLVTNFRVKNLKTRFKVADSIIQQAVKKTLNELECDEISDIDVSSTAIIQQNLEELNLIWNRQFTQAARDSSGLKYYYQKIYQYGILGDNRESYLAYKKTNLLPNGVLVSDFSYIWEGGKARLGFWFDTNGPYNGPNRLGHDIFVYYDKDYGDRTSLCNPLINHSEREKGCYQVGKKRH